MARGQARTPALGVLAGDSGRRWGVPDIGRIFLTGCGLANRIFGRCEYNG